MKRLIPGIICLFLVAGFAASESVAQSSPAGEWVGGYETPGNYVPVLVRFKSDADGIKGTIDAPTRRATNAALDKINFASGTFHFEWPNAGPLVFEGQLNGDFITGNIEVSGGRGTFHLIRTVTLDTKTFDQYVGDYQIGRDRYITVGKTNFPAPGISFTEHDPSNPTLRAARLFPRSETAFVVGPARLIPYPVEINATFVKNDQGQVTALKWKPNGAPEKIGKKVKLHLYDEEEVKFSNGDVTLAGTLSLPLTKGPHPAVVLISGSDGNTRGTGLPGLPQFFAQNGIAALAYDKRGNGASTGDLSVSGFDKLAGDAAAGVRYLQSRPDINSSQVGLWGVSQGGWLAPLAAINTAKVAFVILHAGPAVTPKEQGHMELRSTFPATYGVQGAELKEALAYQDLYYDAMRSDVAYEKLRATYNQLQARGARWAWDPGTKEGLQQSWFRLSMDFDPVPVLEKVRCPVLAFFGEKDGLVPPEGNAAIMEAALKKGGNPDVTIKIIPGVNHLLQLPGIGIYGIGTSGKTPPGYYDVMIGWLRKRVKVR